MKSFFEFLLSKTNNKAVSSKFYCPITSKFDNDILDKVTDVYEEEENDVKYGKTKYTFIKFDNFKWVLMKPTGICYIYGDKYKKLWLYHEGAELEHSNWWWCQKEFLNDNYTIEDVSEAIQKNLSEKLKSGEIQPC